MEKSTQEAGRKRLRQHLVREALYFPLKEGEQSRFAGHGRVHHYAVNFHVGVDFPEGATRISDLYPHARPILSGFINALAHLQGLKKRPVDPNRKKPKKRTIQPAPEPFFDVERYFENTFDRKRDAFTMMRWTAQVVEKIRPEVVAARQARMVESEAMDIDEGGEERSDIAAVVDPNEDTEGATLNIKYCSAPLTYGFYLSCLEAREMKQRAQKERNETRNKKKPFHEAHRFRQYPFAEFETLDAFFFGAVQPFYTAAGLPKGADDDEAFLQIHETNSFRDEFFERGNVRNLDAIFSKERAMIDRTFDIGKDQNRLSSYVPGAYEPVNEDPLLADDDVDIEAVFGGGAEEEQPPAAAPRGRRHVSDYQNRNGTPMYPDVGELKWPRRRAVFRLNNAACLSEIVMPLWPLPFPEGTVYTAVAKGFEPLPDENRLLHLICQLEETERAASLNIALPDTRIRHTSRIADGSTRLETLHVEMESRTMDQVLETMPDAPDEGEVAAEVATTQERHAAMRTSQLRVVRRTLADLSEHYRKRLYGEMVYQNQEDYMFMAESTTNRMALAEFNAVDDERNETQGSQQRAQEMLAELKAFFKRDKEELTPEGLNYILSRVDIFPEWMVNRQAALKMRQQTQLARESGRYKHKKRMERTEQDPNHTNADIEKRTKEEQDELRLFYTEAYNSLYDMFSTSTGFSRSFLEARNFWKDKILPNAADPTGETALTAVLRVRPYIRFQQFLRDTFVASEKVSDQNLPYLERAYNAVYHAHRFYPRRSEPAMNYTMAGTSGVGKSYVIRVNEYLAPPGIIQNMTNATTAAFNVDEDFDNQVGAYEELDTNLLFTNNAGGKDTGASDKINYYKARATSFVTITQYFRYNEETKQREAGRCYSSCHMVMIGATNQNLDGMDPNVRRRLMINSIAERVGATDGGRSIDSENYSLFENSNEGTRLKRMHQELHLAYMFVETAIKAGVEPDVTDDGARTGLFCVQKEVNTKSQIPVDKSTKKNWVLESARTNTIQFACFMALFSPTFHAVYKDEASGIRRWSPEMFNLIVSPLLYIGKDQIKHAATAFDFLYSSREEEQMFLTIANRMCHMGNPDSWVFRKEPGQDRNDTKPDYNYFALRGANLDGLCSRIAVVNNENGVQLRPNDILTMLRPFEKSWTEVAELIPIHGSEGKITSLVAAGDNIPKKARQAIIIEHDPTSATKGACQISFSIQFFLSRFRLDFARHSSEEIKAKLLHVRPILDGKFFGRRETGSTDADLERGWAEATKLTHCLDTRSPFVAGMQHVYSNKTLEYNAYEDEHVFPTPKECFDYMVFYTPDPVKVKINEKDTLTVPLHGVIQTIRGERRADGPLLQRRNYDKPLPTAAALLYRDDKEPDDRPEMMRGFIVDHYDVDFLMATKRMELKAHPGIRFLERAFVKEIANAPEIHRAVPEIRKLNEDVDANRIPARNPLPFNFVPILYRLEQYFGKPPKDERFQKYSHSAVNAFARIHDSVFSNDGTNEAFRSYEDTLGLKRKYEDAGFGPDELNGRVQRLRIDL